MAKRKVGYNVGQSSSSDDSDALFLNLKIENIGEEEDGKHEVEASVQVFSDRVPMPGVRVTLMGGKKSDIDLGMEVSSGIGVANFKFKVEPGEHVFVAVAAQDGGFQSSFVKKKIGEGGGGGSKLGVKGDIEPKIVDRTDRRYGTSGLEEAEYDVYLSPFSTTKDKSSSVKTGKMLITDKTGLAHFFKLTEPPETVAKVGSIEVDIVDGLAKFKVRVDRNTELDAQVLKTTISKEMLFDGPVQFHGGRWALAVGFGLLLTIALFIAATGASFFHFTTEPSNTDRIQEWAKGVEPAKASLKFLLWWLADVVALLVTVILAGITGKKNAKAAIWKLRKLNAERTYEAKTGKDGEKSTTPTPGILSQVGSNKILEGLNVALNMLDLVREKKR